MRPFWGVAPRALLQFVGTELFQHELQRVLPGVGRELWVRRLWQDAEAATRVVISDLRFLHEYRYLKERCPELVVVRVERPGCEWDGREHSSETEFAGIPTDAVLLNDGDLPHVCGLADAFLLSHARRG